MKQTRKGQAAMEFLMTYGWAILVVLAAIGALAYFGVLSPDQFVPERCVISGFECNNHQITESQATISLINTQQSAVDINSITFNGGCFDEVNQTVGESIAARGETSVQTFTCNDGNNTANTLAEIDISVEYVRDGEEITRTAPGEFLARAE